MGSARKRGMRRGRVVGWGDFIGRGERRGSGTFYQRREAGLGARGRLTDLPLGPKSSGPGRAEDGVPGPTSQWALCLCFFRT